LEGAFKNALTGLPEGLRDTPALQPPGKDSDLPASDLSPLSRMPSDNSNTQFGLLAVWVAGRHKVPRERCLALVAQRFRTSQTKDGRWLYFHKADNPQTSAAMIAAGLLGLAVGHGIEGAVQREDAGRRKVDDPAIKKALEALSRHVHQPLGPKADRPRNRELVNLYFLWSLERVGVLYGAQKIGNNDWYQWGAELLVDNQNDDGSWNCGNYHGSHPILDTSLALLFLKKVNWLKDLSDNVAFALDGR
jgi:hypothetical protein